MKTITVEQIFSKLQRDCVPAPLNTRKLIRAFEYDVTTLHQVLDLWHEGKLQNYHMVPGNGSMEF